MNIFIKIFTWVMANGATLIALLQAVVKAIKELLTGVVNLLSLFMSAEKTEKIVASVRGVLNKIDGVLELAKGWLLKK